MSGSSNTNQCMICQQSVTGRSLCVPCQEEMGTRDSVFQTEAQLRVAEEAVAAADNALRVARRREQVVTERLTELRRLADSFVRRRAQRLNQPIPQNALLTPVVTPRGRVTTIEPAADPNRGRPRSDSAEDVVEVVAPAGTPCGRGWLRRRTTPRPQTSNQSDSSEDEGAPECLICFTRKRNQDVGSHCPRMSCSYETCAVCWARLRHSENPACPNCRMVIRDESNR